MQQRRYKYVFGPVPSRRLGRSLGVDLVPLKTCPFDCVYCQLGRTSNKTARRDVYVPTEEVLAELAAKLADKPACDYVTISGSGEPTLHRDLGRIILAIKAMTDVPVAVLTNGALLGDPEVRRALAHADLIMPSLDAGDAETFNRINRPCHGVTFESVVEGLKALRREFRGELRLEVFLVADVNASESQAREIKRIIDQVRPDRVDVNTVTRPPADEDARPVDGETLNRICEILGPRARIIAPHALTPGKFTGLCREAVLGMLRRRPCTIDDMVEVLGCHRWEVAKLLGSLTDEGLIVPKFEGQRLYYQVRKGGVPSK